MFDLIPNHLFYDKNLKWLDPGAGTGYFSVYLYFKLFETLKDNIPNDDERRNHIIKYMIYMVEINDNHVEHLKEVFGEDSNIFNYNFLEVKIAPEKWKFDVVIGNPPFNYRGIKKVPTNTKLKKKHDGATIWGDFVKRGMSLLKNDGYLCYITPSIWMKPDKSRLYHYIRQFKILKLRYAIFNDFSDISVTLKNHLGFFKLSMIGIIHEPVPKSQTFTLFFFT